MDRQQGLPRRGECQARRGKLLRDDPAAERDGVAAYGARLQQHVAGHPDALAPDEGSRHAVAARNGPCGDRHPDGDGARDGRQGRAVAARDGARCLYPAGLGTEAEIARHDHRPVATAGLFLRLGPRGLYHVRCAQCTGGRGGEFPRRGDPGLRGPLQQGLHLSRQATGELGPAFRDGDFRSGGREYRGGRVHVAFPLSAGGRGDLSLRGKGCRGECCGGRGPRLHLHRHDAARDDAGRRRGGGASVG